MSHQRQHDEDRSPADVEKPTSLLAFVKQYHDDATCAAFLNKLRWPNGFVCPKCKTTKAWFYPDRHIWVCNKNHQTSITAGTMMHRSKLPLTLWFYAAYLTSTLTPGISALQLQKQLGLSRYETAFQLLHKLRAALVAPDREPLKGEVEIDESYVGGEEVGRPGRDAVDKALVVVAVEIVRWDEADPKKPDEGVQRTRAGRMRVSVIPDASAATLLPWVVENVAPGTVISTDGWPSYSGLGKLGYTHLTVLQSHQGKPTGRYLPMVHLMFSNIQRWWLGTHKGAVSKKHLQAYLNEFAFRFNRRFWRGPAFAAALGLTMTQGNALEYDKLYGVDEPGGWRHPDPKIRMNTESLDKVVDVLWAEVYADAPPKTKRAMSRQPEAYKAHIRETLKNRLS